MRLFKFVAIVEIHISPSMFDISFCLSYKRMSFWCRCQKETGKSKRKICPIVVKKLLYIDEENPQEKEDRWTQKDDH